MIIKILQIPTGGLFMDGIFSCIEEYLTAMNTTDMDIRVLATNKAEDGIIRRIESIGCKVISIPYRKNNIVKYFFALYRYIKREKIDIVHIHGSSAIMSIELMAAKIAGCKVRIAHSHNTTCENKKIDKFLRPIFNKSYTNAFACGEDAGKWMFGNHKFIVIPNGRDLKKYGYDIDKRNKYRNMLMIPNDALVIGHVGRFNRQKNHEYIVEVFREVIRRNKNSYLVLIGTGEKIDDIRKMVIELELKENVIFTGVIENVADYLSTFDIMLLPSIYEGLPLVVIEWQIAGLPCIISDTITKECAITPLVEFRSIQEKPEVWSREIEKIILQDREKNKESLFDEIRKAGYDIVVEAGKLRKLYLNLFQNTRLNKK